MRWYFTFVCQDPLLAPDQDMAARLWNAAATAQNTHAAALSLRERCLLTALRTHPRALCRSSQKLILRPSSELSLCHSRIRSTRISLKTFARIGMAGAPSSAADGRCAGVAVHARAFGEQTPFHPSSCTYRAMFGCEQGRTPRPWKCLMSHLQRSRWSPLRRPRNSADAVRAYGLYGWCC